jgi:DNA-binding HxlR family transcriptional regulator
MLRERRPNPVSDCPITAAMAAVGGKWKGLVVFHLAHSPKHFAALLEAMPDISKKYSLTDYGRSVVPLVESLRAWGREHIERFNGA